MHIEFIGKVIEGLQVGAKFGIATANLAIVGEPPEIKEGVYYVSAQIVESREQKQAIDYGLSTIDSNIEGILHFGELKTFGREQTCEVHLLHFDQALYGLNISIKVLKFVRETKKFQNADALYTQIEKDVMGAEKYFCRQSLYDLWSKLSDTEKNDQNERALAVIKTNEAFLSAQNIFIYAPDLKREIDFTKALMEAFPDKKYSFPKVVGSGKMAFFTVEQYGDLVAGTYGILEPQIGKIEDDFDLIFVPAVAIDTLKNRLGKGGGFYDRYLDQAKKVAPIISVLPKFSFLEKVPTEGHDQKVDQLILL